MVAQVLDYDLEILVDLADGTDQRAVDDDCRKNNRYGQRKSLVITHSILLYCKIFAVDTVT